MKEGYEMVLHEGADDVPFKAVLSGSASEWAPNNTLSRIAIRILFKYRLRVETERKKVKRFDIAVTMGMVDKSILSLPIPLLPETYYVRNLDRHECYGAHNNRRDYPDGAISALCMLTLRDHIWRHCTLSAVRAKGPLRTYKDCQGTGSRWSIFDGMGDDKGWVTT